MLLRPLTACALALAFSTHAYAADRCVDLSIPKAAIEAKNGKWIALTPEQFQFMRGIYALNPQTPPGLPYGDRAVIAEIDGHPGGMIFWIDGDKACVPMPIPAELVDMMMGLDAVRHEGEGL